MVEKGYNFLFNEFKDRGELACKLAARIASILSEAIRKRGRAVLVVSGGTTPVSVFEDLSGQDMDWSRIAVTLADERWVSPSDPDSNEGLVRRHLLKNRAANASFTGLYTGASQAGEAEGECEKRLKTFLPPIDVLVLGMGGDGHTASLFPGASRLKDATDLRQKRLCMAIKPPDAPHDRMTLTLSILLEAKHIFLHVAGEGKRQVLEKALSGGPREDMPLRFVFAESATPVDIYWAP